MPNLPREFYDWPEDAISLPPEKVVQLYHDGFAGAFRQPVATERLADKMRWRTFGDAAAHFGIQDSGAGKLSLPFKSVVKFGSTIFPGPAQTTGDCVSHGTAKACTITLAVEADLGLADPTTGIVEGFPEVPEPSQGVIATEPIYGYRGHGGQGASCARLADFVLTAGGLLLRKKYDDLGIDLTRYKANTGANWGNRGTPEAVCAEGKKHQVRAVTEVTSVEEARDALANGYGVNCCSGYGFSSTRGDDGVAKRSGGWSHSMAWTAVDDRAETKTKWGGMLFLVQNSWGVWNGGTKAHEQPDGSFWIIERDARGMIGQGGTYAFSNVNGFPGRALPDYMVI